ncbi:MULTISPECIES: SIR2 family NAD-dependent protein deacylase [Burkholderia cepacia complex]|uniref:SIR2 family NAD-dependent protein deacylase n=1 Tax=Burkholderia cepacia complex TaxID=87882 RepID=UPI000981A3F4|nr:SIR2 family protein [Burkholderia cenocepacia]
MKVDNYDAHFKAIQKALRHGNAAVMVGAGFSRNARNGKQLATWADISNELWTALNPDEPPLTSFSTSVVTQLAEQYARVFSKPALEEVLKRLIPDERVHPGTLHAHLLELPWVEIFTTNYDTLLERAAEDIVGRAHYTVSCREDIPQSKILNRRRIVKLHGSFPSQRPFIFTEDEYRRYPTDFAPFVNLVRQSLLENIFCLIGFSGDDPNFLHWIGWVRDMLDQHALPIYLLLNRPPSLGEQKLLDARQVTPIVLPQPPDIDSDDYPARIKTFFRVIDPAQEPEDIDWATNINLPHGPDYSKDIDERKNVVIAAYQGIASLRKTYPDWLIAPEAIRQRLRHTVAYSAAFTDGEALHSVLQDDAYVATAIVAEYAWYQDVALQSLDDKIANEAKGILSITVGVDAQNLKARRAILEPFGAASLRGYRGRWRSLAIALLRWAREGLHRDTFGEIKQLLLNISRDDVQLDDELAHQSVLFSLYEGDRITALRLLNEWEVKSADGYMLVRKGSLLSELGEIDRGLSISLSGLQQLRRDQRSRSDTTRYLSEEAWACAVIGRQQRAIAMRSWRQERQDGAQLAEQLSRRLIDLAVKGIDVRRELDSLDAALSAESATPSDPISILPSFDLGKYTTSTTYGAPGSLREKLNAAFSWLTLADRIGLVPRIANVNFCVDSFLCAGWWVQYADSMERVLSILVRTLSIKAFEQRKPTELSHSAGWLSRFQVGKTAENIATRLCETSLSLLENVLGGALPDDAEITLSFHIQLFGRLVIRISDANVVMSYAKRIVAIHQQQALAQHRSQWGHFATALKRCFEAIPPAMQRQLLPNIWEIATMPTSEAEHFSIEWVPLHYFYPRVGLRLQASEKTLAIETKALLEALEWSNSRDEQLPREFTRTWEYLFLLDSWSLLDDSHKKEFGYQLWGKSEEWPIIPGFRPEAAYSWPHPDGVDHHKALREWILGHFVLNFPFRGSITSTSKVGARQWGFPVDNTVLEAFTRSFKEERWPIEDLRNAALKIKAWWSSEWPEISIDINRVEQLREECLERLDCIDVFLASIASDPSLAILFDEEGITQWIDEMLIASAPSGARFRRFRVAKALAQNDATMLWQMARELVEEIGDPDITVALRFAPQVITFWLAAETGDTSSAFRFLTTSLASFVAARRMPALSTVLRLIAEVTTRRPDLLDAQTLALIEVGLGKMQHELRYKGRKEGSGIPDDNVPAIRLQCANLALAMHKHLQMSAECVDAWLEAAATDPLPEMRFVTQWSPS